MREDPEPQGDGDDADQRREIKVKLPVALHIRLQTLKITRGRGISDVVTDALEQFFTRQELGRDPKKK